MASFQIQYPCSTGYTNSNISTNFLPPLQIKNTQMGLLNNHENNLRLITKHLPNPFLPDTSFGYYSKPPKIICGLRDGPKQPMWRSRVLSTETIQVVQSLKLAKTTSQLQHVINNKLTRLLKADLIDTLTELKRQNELHLAHKVFDFIRSEVWYKPDSSFYCDMIFMFGKRKMIETALQLFGQLIKEGVVVDTRTYTEMIGAYLHVGMVDNAMEMYKSMKKLGCVPDRLTLTILIRNLDKAGEEELALLVKKDSVKYVDHPKKFLEEVGKKYPKRKSFEFI